MEFAALQQSTTVDGEARVVASSLDRTKNGDSFWRLTLADRSGDQLPAVCWGRDSTPPRAGSVVRFRGFVKEFRDSLSLTLSTCEIDETLDAGGFLPRMPAARNVSPADLDALIASIADGPLRQTVEVCFDRGVREQFLVYPAAMKMHGAVVGGLLAHTVKVAGIALSLGDLTFSPYDRDLLVAAALLHDIGKLDEHTPTPGEEPTEEGRLLGHIVPGVMRIMEASHAVPELSEARRNDLLHAVIASHGKKEFGSPAVPATLEAVLLHLADESEATIEASLAAIEATPAGAVWTDYVKSIDARLRVRNRHA